MGAPGAPLFFLHWAVIRFERADVECSGSNWGGAAGLSGLLTDQTPTVWSVDAERIFIDGACTARLSTLPVWPYNASSGSSSAEKWSGASLYFHMRTVRSSPEETTCDGEMNFAALIEEVCPPSPAGGEVARICEDIFQTRNRPS